MAARQLLKCSSRDSPAAIFRLMQREFSSCAKPDLTSLFERRALICGTHFSIADGSSNKDLSFSKGIRWLGSRADTLTKSKVNGSGGKKSTWTCPKCGSVNGAHHQRCMGCQEPDSVAIGRSPTFGFGLGADSHNTSRVGLPRSIVKFCVNRSPHIDKKSREQFEMRINKLYMVVKTRSEDLQKKFFWLKRQRILGAQYEIIFSYKTRLPIKDLPSDNP